MMNVPTLAPTVRMPDPIYVLARKVAKLEKAVLLAQGKNQQLLYKTNTLFESASKFDVHGEPHFTQMLAYQQVRFAVKLAELTKLARQAESHYRVMTHLLTSARRDYVQALKRDTAGTGAIVFGQQV